ncbi:ornithine cyclodeaminase family protein [Paenibacillus sp. N3.4]|uniref:ornithine cyclodeaminase family protein n=1 Tax=Paenibacillus sp. N3.4 TaxID=2603222 RepID=UPI0011C72912|nr:ornithine cyclodeaminase family protein [Paenibacillus sp. N3.4]TXK85949.1 ornithine cyclodeaminase family protein [Paenibacillus sp. N3.4]
MLILGIEDQKRAITMPEVLDSVSLALSSYSGQKTVTPVRVHIPVVKHEAVSLFMPSYVEQANSLGVKFVSVFPHNQLLGKKTIYGMMILADTETGEPLALMDASYLTVIRTGAASGVAAKYLAREDARVMTMIGTGAQAPGLIDAIRTVRPIEKLRLFNRTRVKALDLAAELKQRYGSEAPDIEVLDNPDDAIYGADIVVTATTSNTPVFLADSVVKGMHLSSIGAFRPTMQEVPADVMIRADKVVVESKAAVLEETGDVVIPLRQGLFTAERITSELGEIIAGTKPGRESADELTIFKSVGLAAMDVVVAKAIYDRALELGIGQRINF